MCLFADHISKLNRFVGVETGARSKFFFGGGWQESEDFAHATLPTTLLDFKDKIKNFCHPTLLKIRFKIAVTLPAAQKEQSQNYDTSINSNGLFTLTELLSLKFLLHMATSFMKERYHFNNCI